MRWFCWHRWVVTKTLQGRVNWRGFDTRAKKVQYTCDKCRKHYWKWSLK